MSEIQKADCEALAERLSLFSLGDLPLGEQQALTEHLTNCLACQRRLEQLRAIASALTQGQTSWLDVAAGDVLQRVASELHTEVQVSKQESARLAGEPPSPRRIAAAEKSGKRSTVFWAGSSLVTAMAGLALFGWWSRWWQTERTGAVTPTEVSTVESTASGMAKVAEGFPTWWELQRSLGESEELFERTLARGRSGGSVQSLEMNHLLEELR